MQKSLSVILCTHNPRQDYLSRTLKGLAEQTLPKDDWELIVVDNGSTEPLTATLVGSHPHARVVREDDLGLTPARICGFGESHGAVLVFVDDDNVLASDYLANVVEIADAYPFLGVFGAGVIEPEFEIVPASWSEPYLPMLALRSCGEDLWGNDLGQGFKPYGAGICLGRQTAEAFVRGVKTDPRRLRLGRNTKQLSSCEDYDMAFTAVELGLGFGIFARLRLKHLIPKERLNEDYLLRLRAAMAESHALLYYIWHAERPSAERPRLSWRQRVRKIVKGRSIHERFREAAFAGEKNARELIRSFES